MKDAFGNPQSVLVLGGGSDIALAVVEILAERRCRRIVLAGRRPEVLEGAASHLRRQSRSRDLQVETVAFDALARSSHADLMKRLFSESGGFDVVIVAFGILSAQPGLDEDPVSAARVVEVNLSGAVSTMLAASSEMRRQGRGTLVVLSSVAGIRVRAANFVYGASKAGLDGFSQGLADALAGTGVNVMIVRPGFVVSKMTDGMKKAPLAVRPGDVARAVVAGLERQAAVVWVPSSLRYVMGALRLLPRSLFRMLPG